MDINLFYITVTFEVSTIVIPIFQVGKVTFREVRGLAQRSKLRHPANTPAFNDYIMVAVGQRKVEGLD